MECPFCEKTIPEESIFCMYCGECIDDSEYEEINENPPIALVIERFRPTGPVDIKKGGFWSDDKIGRGVYYIISLRDSENRVTVAEGELVVVMYKPAGWQGDAPIREATIDEARKTAREGKKWLFSKTVAVSIDDFDYATITYSNGMESTHLVYEYMQTSPLLYVSKPVSSFTGQVIMLAWFITADQRCMFNSALVGKWR